MNLSVRFLHILWHLSRPNVLWFAVCLKGLDLALVDTLLALGSLDQRMPSNLLLFDLIRILVTFKSCIAPGHNSKTLSGQQLNHQNTKRKGFDE